MGKKGVEDMIEEIGMFLDNCKPQPFSNNKVIVPKDEMIQMLDELKMKLPNEIERCKKIMRNKEAILASARTRSDAIISESVNEANRLVDANHITELANIRANEILEMARNQAQQIVDDATAEATEIRLGAMSYTRDRLSQMKEFFEATLEADREHYRSLVDSLESNIYTMDSNIDEMDASINLLTGNAVAPSEDAPDDGYDASAAPASQVDAEEYDDGFDDDDDYDDDDYDDDYDDDDDFLDE
jgi:vacuolar-type H+-ATPase subunit H